MPTYDYRCNGCGHHWEEFQSMGSKAIRACPECGKRKAERLIGSGAGIIFKGSGFYETDYRSESYQRDAKADGPKADSTKETKEKKADSTGDSGSSSSTGETKSNE